MAEQLTPLESGTDLNQALRFHSRVRRKSLAGVPKLHRTHRFHGAAAMAVPAIATGDVFPNRLAPITFQTAIRINAGAVQGMIFEFGDATTGCALWMQSNRLTFRAGGSVGSDGAAALFSPGIPWPENMEFDVVASIIPGSGRIRVWVNGRREIDSTATNGSFGANGWASTDDGSFADAPASGIPANIPAGAQIAPSNFEVIEPLSVYAGQVPRHFV